MTKEDIHNGRGDTSAEHELETDSRQQEKEREKEKAEKQKAGEKPKADEKTKADEKPKDGEKTKAEERAEREKEKAERKEAKEAKDVLVEVREEPAEVRGSRPTFTEKRTVQVGTERVQPGEMKHIHFKITETAVSSPVYMPVTVINGNEPGPAVFITGAIHGDELNGVQIVRELIEMLTPDLVKGTLLCVPVVNVLGFQVASRYLPDRRDLNRVFPGERNGNAAERYAAAVFELISQCNYGIDLHTAAEGRSNMPHVRGEMEIPEIRRLARAFGTEIILDKGGDPGSLRQNATRHGIPTILLEAGEANRFQRGTVKEGVQGVRNVLQELGILAGKPLEPKFRVIVKKTEWVRTDRGGIVEMRTHPRALVYQGDEICIVSNPFGRERDIVRAPFNGMVVGVSTQPIAEPGTPVCHLVKLDKTLERIEKELAEETGAVCRL